MMLLLAPTSSGYQNLVIEMPVCATLGDRVWRDANSNGLQDAQRVTLGPGLNAAAQATYFNIYSDGHYFYGYTYPATEPGINGVTVQLYDSTNANLVATTTTGPSPAGYPYLPPRTAGYYQFAGLCPGTYYLQIPNASTAPQQPPLSGLAPTTVHAGGTNVGNDSDNPSGEMAVLPAASGAPVTEVVDFGFTGPQPIQIACAPQSATWIAGNFYSSSVTATGGIGPYTYSILSSGGQLPQGMSINPNTGEISGTPSAGTYSFTVQVMDSRNSTAGTATQSCQLVIAPPPTATCASIVNAVAGVAITPVQLQGSGGVGPTYTFTSSNMPAGLILDSNGLIHGTPQNSGTQSYSVTVHDSAGNTSTINCQVTVAPPPSVNCAVITNAVAGVAITPVQLQGSGGIGPTYTFTSSNMPAGLILDSNGLDPRDPAEQRDAGLLGHRARFGG